MWFVFGVNLDLFFRLYFAYFTMPLRCTPEVPLTNLKNMPFGKYLYSNLCKFRLKSNYRFGSMTLVAIHPFPPGSLGLDTLGSDSKEGWGVLGCMGPQSHFANPLPRSLTCARGGNRSYLTPGSLINKLSDPGVDSLFPT